jgi:hypothetical protein
MILSAHNVLVSEKHHCTFVDLFILQQSGMILITTEDHHDAAKRQSIIWVQSLIFNENELSTSRN